MSMTNAEQTAAIAVLQEDVAILNEQVAELVARMAPHIPLLLPPALADTNT